MKTNTLLLILFSGLLLFSCSEDDSLVVDANELRDETIATLTSNGEPKTWRINQAILINGDLEIDISQNFNVIDDEFIFEGNSEDINVKWKKGNDIKTTATNSQGAIFDKNVSSSILPLNFRNNDSSILEVASEDYSFQLLENNSIKAVVENSDGTTFNFTLVEKTDEDYASAPVSGLNFSEAFTFESSAIHYFAPGMIGSHAENSVYIATRESEFSVDFVSPERIIKYDVSNNTSVENLFYEADFVSKQLQVIGDKLIAVGGTKINTYDLDFSNEPSSQLYLSQNALSRYGTSVINNDIFVIGGPVNPNAPDGDKIYKWNTSSQSLIEFTNLDAPKSGARAAIFDDNMYIFGGTEIFFGDSPEDTILKINLDNPDIIETFQMDVQLNFTFVKKYQNLIYVAGSIVERDENSIPISRQASIGVFNTLNNTYQTLDTNLTNPSGFDTIHQMCILNGKMYIIYGNEGEDNGGPLEEWKVLVSDLN